MTENVIILGAGASADSGAPLMNNFLDKAEDILSSNSLDQDSKIHFERIFELLNEMQKVHSKARLDLNNIETVFGAIEMATIIKRFGTKSIEEIQEYKDSIVRLIIETIEHSMNFYYEGLAIYAPDSYNNLVNAIKNSSANNNTSIITFNYDLGIDTALSRQGYGINYGFENKTLQPNDFSLFKLHGSINWAYCEADQNIYPYYPEWYLRDLHAQTGYNLRGSIKLHVSKYFSHIRNHHKSKIEVDKTKSVIVPPSWNKNSYHGTISTVWQKASEKLSNAKNIVIIGYSLPESDSFFRYLFALGTLGSTRIRNIIVVNPEIAGGDVDNRFKGLIGESILSRYKYIEKKFNYANEIIPNLIN
jgi:NAD-dependent SIR2 family protein deacetylase